MPQPARATPLDSKTNASAARRAGPDICSNFISLQFYRTRQSILAAILHALPRTLALLYF
jgi:hypothetical protein